MCVLLDEHSRVVLPRVEEDPLSTYINANYVRVCVFCICFASRFLIAQSAFDLIAQVVWHLFLIYVAFVPALFCICS